MIPLIQMIQLLPIVFGDLTIFLKSIPPNLVSK